MNSKKYVIGFLLIVGIVFGGNVILWYGYTKDCFISNDGHGDLTRMAALPHEKSQTDCFQYDKSHIEFKDYWEMQDRPRIDILTVGDSFSNGKGGTYYQDYLVDKYGKVVMNIPKIGQTSPVTTLRTLISTGIMEEISPQVVVLSSAEKLVVERMDGHDKTMKKMPREEFIRNLIEGGNNNDLAFDGILPGIMPKYNLLLLERLKRNYKYDSDSDRLCEEVHKEMLTQQLFTDKDRENMLLFHHDDLWWQGAHVDFEQIDENLSELAAELKKLNIQLVVMIAVDKADLYHPYIVDSGKYMENTFMRELSYRAKDYVYIDTKDILRELLAKGEKDIYWQDDTHWSWKAEQRVMDVLMEKVRFDN